MAAAISRTDKGTDITVCLGSACADGRSFEGFNSGTGSSFIYHPDVGGSHAGRCSKARLTLLSAEIYESEPGVINNMQLCLDVQDVPDFRFGAEFVQLTSFPER